MSQQNLIRRIETFLNKHNQAFCESCLVERLMVASRAAFRNALATKTFSVRIGTCADCRTRKQVVTVSTKKAAAA